jgi:hypothetical protein
VALAAITGIGLHSTPARADQESQRYEDQGSGSYRGGDQDRDGDYTRRGENRGPGNYGDERRDDRRDSRRKATDRRYSDNRGNDTRGMWNRFDNWSNRDRGQQSHGRHRNGASCNPRGRGHNGSNAGWNERDNGRHRGGCYH